MKKWNIDIQLGLFKILWTNRNTPSTTATGKSANEMLSGFRPRSHLSSVHPLANESEWTEDHFRGGDSVVLSINNQKLKGIVIRILE